MKLFKKKNFDDLLIEAVRGENANKFIDQFTRTNQEHYFRLQRKQREDNMKEKYEYYLHLKNKGRQLTKEEEKEFDFLEFKCNKNQLNK